MPARTALLALGALTLLAFIAPFLYSVGGTAGDQVDRKVRRSNAREIIEPGPRKTPAEIHFDALDREMDEHDALRNVQEPHFLTGFCDEACIHPPKPKPAPKSEAERVFDNLYAGTEG
jgi:hypothetical protein